MKRALVVAAILLVVLLVFGVYSLDHTFGNWPWTTTSVIRHGQYLGFKIGDSKQAIFDQVIRNQTAGLVVDLKIDEPGVDTYPEIYRGDPVKAEDFDRVAKIDTWYFGIQGCNCWGYLGFENSHLTKITKHRYRGPTDL